MNSIFLNLNKFRINRGKLIPEKLEEMINHSISIKEKPFMVALTAGTTVLGK
jgi:hypothetical protein